MIGRNQSGKHIPAVGRIAIPRDLVWRREGVAGERNKLLRLWGEVSKRYVGRVEVCSGID